MAAWVSLTVAAEIHVARPAHGPIHLVVAHVSTETPTQGAVAVMDVAVPPNDVRQLVARTFQAFGVELLKGSDLEETILINGGKYLARSYRSGGLMAMWLVDVGIVQFYDAEGNLLQTADLQSTSMRRQAA